MFKGVTTKNAYKYYSCLFNIIFLGTTLTLSLLSILETLLANIICPTS